MIVRCSIICLIFCAGCRMPSADRGALATQPAPEIAQSAGEGGVATAHFEGARPASAAPSPTADTLGLASSCIESGDSAGAAVHLNQHVRAHPDQVMIRAYLAEILFKLNRYLDAQDQFERFIAEAQDAEGPARKQILHCHTRLMEIAQERDDSYGEHLHRGIGFVLLARQLESASAGGEAEPSFRERLLCKASAELTRAAKLRPDEPRPPCYLFEVWTKLDQPRSAEKSLRTAKHLAALLPLAPSEQRALVLAK